MNRLPDNSLMKCNKHPYIEVIDTCVRCGQPICVDCRLREPEEPFCSTWCLRMHRLESGLLSSKKEKNKYSEDITYYKRLVPIADLSIAVIILALALSSYLSVQWQSRHLLAAKVDVEKPVFLPDEDILPPPVSLLPTDETDATVAPEPVSPEEISLPIKVVKKLAKEVKKPAKKIKPRKKKRRPVPAGNIYSVRSAGKKISITFDGGSSDASAKDILDILSLKGIKTTFFLAGTFIKKYPEIVRKVVREGHEVGNHTLTHPHLTTYGKNRRHKTAPGVDLALLKKELEETAKLFKKVTGTDMAPYWRAPFGEINSDILKWASGLGYRHIAWTYDYKKRESMDSLDWVADKDSSLYLTADEIKERLLSFADASGRARGGIVLMHLGTERREEVVHEKLGDIIDGFISKGYEVVPVSTLLKSTLLKPKKSG